MTKNYKHIILLICYSLFWASPTMASFENSKHSNNELFSISKDSLTTKKSDTTKTREIVVENPLITRWQKEKAEKKVASAIVTDKKFKSFPELDNYTKNLYLPPNDSKAEFTPEYIQSLFKVDNKTQEVLDAGAEVMAIIEQNQRFIDIITGQEVIDLPVGIKQDISDNYTKSSDWLHTGDISFNFKGIDFYKGMETNKFIQETLIPELNDLIEEAGNSNLNLNEYFKQVVNPPLGTLLTN